ncbi:MAG: tetratricopeptide repeat protein [Cyanobacteria bacterium J06633_2]
MGETNLSARQQSMNEQLAIARHHYAHRRFAEAEVVAHRLVAQIDAIDRHAFEGEPGVEASDTWIVLTVDSYMMLGLSLQQQRKFDDAQDCYEHIIQIAPDHSPAYNNLALILKAQEDYETAIYWLEQAIAIQPTNAAAYTNLGNVLRHQNQLSQAQVAYEKALRHAPDHLDARLNLGLVCRDQGDIEGAIAHYQAIITADPAFVDAYNELGNLLQSCDAFEEAVRCYEAALHHAPTSTSLHNNLGAALQELGRHDAAIASYHRALQHQPTYADAYYNLGNVLRSLDRLDDAVVAYQQARVLMPNDAKVHNNLGLVLHDQGDINGAIACYRRSIQQEPDYPDAHLNLGISLLKAGDWIAGFKEYEWRWKVTGQDFKPLRSVAQPVWHGQDLPEQTLLIHAEQGLGDTLQFIRFVSLIEKRVHRIIVECQAPLKRLLEAMPSIDQVIVSGDEIPPFDVHVPLMSLPYLLSISPANLPPQVPYLHALAGTNENPLLTASTDDLKVGIVWAGSPTHRNNRHRSCPFQSFERLLTVPGIRVYSLQKGAGEADLDSSDAAMTNLSAHLDDMADTAAAIAQLDVVITVDTSVAHLAGALGKPVWIVLGFAYDWRWLSDRSDSPWYPTARLFHQSNPGDWDGVFDQVIQALKRHLDKDAPLTLPGARRSPLPDTVMTRQPHAQDERASERMVQLQQAIEAKAWDEVVAQCSAILNDYPTHPQALEVMGRLAYQQKQYKQAIACFEQLCEFHPVDASIWSQLGNAYLHSGAPEAAILWYQLYLDDQPTASAVRNNLGVALRALRRDAEAIAHYRLILEYDPESVDTVFNLANALREQDRLDEAVLSYQEVVTRKPDYAHAWNNLANALKDLNRIDEAIACYRKAIALAPNHASAHHNLGYALLLTGDIESGFAEYEWRWQVKNFQSPRRYPQPLWDGSPLDGKTILLYTEQGFGDAIQFIRFVPLVVERGGRVVLECRAPLARLFGGIPEIEAIALRDSSLPTFDVHAPLMSLPHLMKITSETLPSTTAYLSVPEDAEVSLSLTSATKIGIAWAGSPTHKNDHHRSCPFAYFWSLLRTPDTEFFSLQKGPRRADIQGYCNEDWPIVDLSDRLNDFADTAAAIAQLDLVITVDTSVAHLAAALGKPTWIVLSHAPDWRWALNRTDSPWYPTVRLFRQPAPGDWSSVFTHVRSALREFIPSPPLLHPSTPLPLIPSGSDVGHSSLLSDSSARSIGIGIELSTSTGWGTFGTNLTLQLLKSSDWNPRLLLPPFADAQFSALHQALLKPVLEAQQQFERGRHQQEPFRLPCVVLKALGNHFVTAPPLEFVTGEPTVGLIFFEDAALTSGDMEKAKAYDLIIAGSSWNTDVLRAHDIHWVKTVCQGIDPTLFHPAPRSNLFGDRFVIFSGGKLEYRKGHDIVIEAFRRFHHRHSDALLLTAWHNIWPNTIQSLEQSNYVAGRPILDESGTLQFIPWLEQNGVLSSAVIDLGAVANPLMGHVMREADVALFPNRCEGGTNLVAMECLACGVPTILSANTGHLDLLGDGLGYALNVQHPVQTGLNDNQRKDWGESDIDEILHRLEDIYRDQANAKAKALNDAQVIQEEWSWEVQVKRLMAVLDG